MRAIRILTILCAFVPMVAAAQDRHPKRVVITRKTPAPWDVVAPGVLRQDLFIGAIRTICATIIRRRPPSPVSSDF